MGVRRDLISCILFFIHYLILLKDHSSFPVFIIDLNMYHIILFCTLFCFALAANVVPLGPKQECAMDQPNGKKHCEVDGYVGSEVIYEDDRVRVWNFTLAPGQMTSMHRHDFDYHFVAVQPTQLEVWGEDGTILFDFRAEGTLGFKIEGDYLVPISENVRLPHIVPRTHAAKNIGPNPYHEILFESKLRPDGGNSPANEL